MTNPFALLVWFGGLDQLQLFISSSWSKWGHKSQKITFMFHLSTQGSQNINKRLHMKLDMHLVFG